MGASKNKMPLYSKKKTKKHDFNSMAVSKRTEFTKAYFTDAFNFADFLFVK